MLVLIADPEAEFRAGASAAVDDVGEVAEATGGAEIAAALEERGRGGAVVVIGPNVPPERVVPLAERIQESAPHAAVISFASELTDATLRDAMRAGICDVLAADYDPIELRDAVKRAGSQMVVDEVRSDATPATGPTGGRVVTVFSPKGGSGTSVVASNLAILLGRAHGEQVALVDLDLESGDLAVMLQAAPKWTIHDATRKLDGLDGEALDSCLERLSGGLKLLAAPTDPSLATMVADGAVRRVLELLRASSRHVVVDTPSAFTPQLLAALDDTDTLVLVTALDVPTIKSTRIALLTLRRLGWDDDRVRLVLNRVDDKVGLRPRDVEKSLGMRVDAEIPASVDVPLSVNEGVPLAMRRGGSPVNDGLVRLAAELAGTAEAGGASRRGWLLGRAKKDDREKVAT